MNETNKTRKVGRPYKNPHLVPQGISDLIRDQRNAIVALYNAVEGLLLAAPDYEWKVGKELHDAQNALNNAQQFLPKPKQ